MTKTLSRLRIEGDILNLIKCIYEKSTTNIILNGERLKTFLLRLRTRQGCLLLTLLFSIVLEFLARELSKKES
jgi:hypothetical protein